MKGELQQLRWMSGSVYAIERTLERAKQMKSFDKIAEHIATSMVVEMEDFHDGWFGQRGDLGKASELFSDRSTVLIADMNRALTA